MLLHQVLHFLIAYGLSGSLTLNAAHCALQTDTCDAAAPQCHRLGSLEFQKCWEAAPMVQLGFVCLAVCSTVGHKVARLIIQAENFDFSVLFFLQSELGLVPVV